MRITIPLRPVSKKNNQQVAYNPKIKRYFIVQSERYKAYEKAFLKLVRSDEPIDRPVNVQMVFYMPTERNADLVNLEECCLDCLVRAGVLADDNHKIVKSMDGSCVMYDKDNPRTEVLIEYI